MVANIALDQFSDLLSGLLQKVNVALGLLSHNGLGQVKLY